MPPALILSQDQTLQKRKVIKTTKTTISFGGKPPAVIISPRARIKLSKKLKSKLFKIEISEKSETHQMVMFEPNFWFVIVQKKLQVTL